MTKISGVTSPTFLGEWRNLYPGSLSFMCNNERQTTCTCNNIGNTVNMSLSKERREEYLQLFKWNCGNLAKEMSLNI